jgi:hypothetical protein
MPSEAYSTDCETLHWPNWTGATAVCIATGPSLTPEQVETVKHSPVRCIGINDVGLTEDWLDIWYAADWQFWKHYQARATASSALKVCADMAMRTGRIADLFLSTLDRERAEKFEPGFAISGGHSGFQALQLAISLGARKVILLGYDCRPTGEKTNYFGRKPKALHRSSDYKSWPKYYRELRLPDGVEVFNATPGSAIDAFPVVELASAI